MPRYRYPPEAVLPVICGFDIADYAFARIFHESLGIRSLVITDVKRGPIDDSSIVDTHMVPLGTLGDEEKFITCLHEVARAHPDERLILCVNTDEGVEFAARHREELEPRWFLPYADAAAVTRANSKEAMAEVFTSLGLAAPARTIVDLSEPDTWKRQLSRVNFPIVVKPEDGADLNFHWKQGLRKAMPVETLDDALATFAQWQNRGISIRLIVQELIPGDDTTQWVLNGYVDSKGVVTATGCGQVLLGLHQPEVIGNAAMILVHPREDLIASAHRIVAAAGLRGFFSLDVKIDPRTGTPYWLDVNPRIGRGHYYMKVGGIDLVRSLIADMFHQTVPFQGIVREGIYTVVPMCLANKTYITDVRLRATIRRLRRGKHVYHPLKYSQDRHPKRWIYRVVNGINQLRYMREYYPRPTISGF